MDGSEAGLEPTDTGHDSTCALYATQQQLVACANLPVEQPTNQPFNNKGTPQDQNRQWYLCCPTTTTKVQDSHQERRLQQTSDNLRGQTGPGGSTPPAKLSPPSESPSQDRQPGANKGNVLCGKHQSDLPLSRNIAPQNQFFEIIDHTVLDRFFPASVAVVPSPFSYICNAFTFLPICVSWVCVRRLKSSIYFSCHAWWCFHHGIQLSLGCRPWSRWPLQCSFLLGPPAECNSWHFPVLWDPIFQCTNVAWDADWLGGLSVSNAERFSRDKWFKAASTLDSALAVGFKSSSRAETLLMNKTSNLVFRCFC